MFRYFKHSSIIGRLPRCILKTDTTNTSLLIRNLFINNSNLPQTTKMSNGTIDEIENCKKGAAYKAVNDYIKEDCIVGIGSGSTMRYVLERLDQLCKENGLSVRCIPTSFQSKQLIHEYQLPLTDLERDPIIDVTIDGADEVDDNLVAIKGGGACLAQEKVIAAAANKFIVVADYRKNSKYLGDSWTKGIPIEVLPMACNFVRNKICSMMDDVQLKDIVIRIGKEKAGPVITDNGNFVVDWKFDKMSMVNFSKSDWDNLANKLKFIPGVVETGIFANMIHEAYFGQPNKEVIQRKF